MKTNLVIFFLTKCISKHTLTLQKGKRMKKHFYNTLIGVSVLPALFIMPAMAETITQRQVISTDTTYTDAVAENIASTTANNGGVFYMQDVPEVVLEFQGETLFSGNSLNDGGMGGVIGNGWLSSTSGSGYTQGGKILFTGSTTFAGNSTNNANGGGAIFNYGLGSATNPDIIFLQDAEFANNLATQPMNGVYAGGGAINHRNGMIVFNEGANFSGNESASQGGAILTAGDIIFNGPTSFANNTATTNGGALAIMGGTTTFDTAATFTKNSAGGASAIYLSEDAETLEFKGAAIFSENSGVGTLFNSSANASVIFVDGAEFNKNTNSYNGALINAGNVSLTGGDMTFSNNTGSNGGGLKNTGTVTTNTTGKILFSSNSTTSTAGALDNGGDITFNASQISFTGNKSDSGYAGAIFNAGDLTILSAKNTFSNNIANDSGTTKSGGGAIHNRGNTNTASLVIGTSDSINTFASNKSNAYGGAIVARAFDGDTANSDVVINGKTTFSSNTSALDGGAIWNAVSADNGTTGTSTIVFNGDTTFRNNSAGGIGGAVYNNDTITFNGTTVFSGNAAGGKANDIHNDGTVNFNGDTTINSGITGTGTLNVASGTTLNIGTSDITQGAIALDGTMLATLRSGETSQITVNNEGGFTGTGKLKLSFDHAGTYQVFGNQTFDNVDISSSVYDLSWDNGAVTATTKSVSDLAQENNITQDTARVISSISESSSTRLNDLSVAFQEKLSSGTASDLAEVEQAGLAINPERAAVPQSVATSSQHTISTLLSNRLAMSGLGRSGGDANLDFGGVWAQGLYNKSKLNDNFNGYTRGVALGVDGTINEVWTLGMGYMFAHSDISATSRDTDVDSSTVFIYGQYKPSQWYASAIVNYTMSDYNERGRAFNVGVTSDYDIDTFGARLASGYNFIGGITPEVSMQYMHINSSDYTNSLGIKNHMDGADYLTASLSTKYEFDIYMNNGWIVRPQLHYAIKYDLISDENTMLVSMPGVNSYVLDGQRLSRIANEVGLGIGMNYNGLEMSLNYDIQARSNYTSQTGRMNFRYEF